MLDINFNVYLLEINTNPGSEISSPWIKAIVPRMVDDALRLTIDEVFPPKYQFDKNSIIELNYEEYSNDLIHKEEKKEEEKKEGPRLVKRKKYTTICDQGSGAQDQGEEPYKQENIRQREVIIQKKINEPKIEDIKNNENSAKKVQNGNEDIKEILLDKNSEEVVSNNINNDKNDNKQKEKEEKEKPFNQTDYKSPYPVPGYEPWENLWELICDLNEEKPQNNNYTAGVRALLEIQKKRQTSSAPTSNEINNIKKVVKNNINNNNTQKDKNIMNGNKIMNNIKDNKKEKKIEDKKMIIKKNNENLMKKEKNTKETNLNKNKEKEKKIKENNNKNVKKIEEERKNNEINKDIYEKEDKKIIQNNTTKEENKEISEKENNEIGGNIEKVDSNEQKV
jgi:hypothetical protein